MRKIKIFENIEIFEIQNESIYAGNKDNLFVYNKYFNLVERYEGHIFYMLKYKYNLLFRIGNNEITYILNNPNIKELPNTTLMGNFIDGDYMYLLCSDDLINKYDKNCNLENTYNIGRFPKLIFQNKFLRTPNNSIICYDLDSNIQLWQHNFSDLLEGENVSSSGNILVNNDLLYISLSDWVKGGATFCIDVNTGKIVKKLETLGFIQLENDVIYSVHGDEIRTVNTKNFETKTIQIEELIKEKLYINKSRWVIQDHLLYFIDGDIMPNNKMGIIDLDTQKLVWQTALTIKGGINHEIKEIRVQDNRLYAHCADNTLHIFEKE
ncbi:hypothetical protein FACS1894182_11790 [Bacteroidia bacterium]|nr:hypothetical protein FACS1894182_11790 [Bacteroidia bacterium]